MKRTISIVLSVFLLLSLCACGQKDTPATWQEQYDLGVRYLSEGDYEEAIIAFTAAIEIDPKNKDAYLGRASAYMESGAKEDNLTAAMADYQAVLEIDDLCVDAYLGTAEIYIAQGDLEKAEEILKEGGDKTGEKMLYSRAEELENEVITDYQGRVIRERSYTDDGELLYYIDYTYLPTAEYEYWKYDTGASYDSVGNQTGYVKCEYDKDGNCIKDFYQYIGEMGIVYIKPLTRIFNDKGLEVQCDFHEMDGSLCGRQFFEYDSENNRISQSIYGDDGRCERVTFYEYLDGRIQRQIDYDYDESGEVNYSIVTDYDINGNVTGTFYYDSDGILTERLA